MAGRPSAGSQTGLMISMIVFASLTVVFLVLLVVLWTSQEELKAGKEEAEKQANRLMSSGEKGMFQAWFDQASASNTSVAKMMSNDIEGLSKIVSSEAGAIDPGMASRLNSSLLATFWDQVKEDAKQKRIEDGAGIADQPLLEALKGVYDSYKRMYQQKKEQEDRNADLDKQVKNLTDANRTLQDGFDAASNDIRARIAKIEDEWNTFRTDKDQLVSNLEAAQTAQAEEEIKKQKKIQTEMDSLKQELAKRDARAKELQEKIREFQILPQPRMAARQADGVIMKTEPGGKTTFIDLGRVNHLTLGMRFAVYSRDTGIPSDGKSKGAVEVVQIGEEVSQCKIVWENTMNPVIESDLVANPVYDRSRKLSYFVMGAFDLDHDGQDDPYGKETIEAVIKDAGGVIADSVSSRVDFVVVGARPLVREIPGTPTDEEKAIHKDQLDRAARYETDFNEALSLSIPLMTQETFLNFMGRKM